MRAWRGARKGFLRGALAVNRWAREMSSPARCAAPLWNGARAPTALACCTRCRSGALYEFLLWSAVCITALDCRSVRALAPKRFARRRFG